MIDRRFCITVVSQNPPILQLKQMGGSVHVAHANLEQLALSLPVVERMTPATAHWECCWLVFN